eukprot:TRINITY_DN8940_c0_g1_i1.p1 TRINITY_DN8940_c0_g1~~TRINITY_DN8940_c0_g1_i1.p1  ORF type:complete len:114 (+),score=11.73 TRINITY_DN8940_c0_g1_i1:22-342(+)
MAAKALPVIIELATELGQAFVDSLGSGSVVMSQPQEGTWFLSSLYGQWGTYSGQVVACFYHPTKKHTATTEGKNGEKRSVAEAGHWAISCQTRGLFGNKTHYNTVD